MHHACVCTRGCAPPPQAGCTTHRTSPQTTTPLPSSTQEYYDYKDMPPLPLTVARITIPQLGYTVVDKANEARRMASLAIFFDLFKDDQYK